MIINTYVGMVFTAIGTDFYPRLAAVNQDNAACRSVISQQGEIASQILAPLLCGCILLMPLILRILYSDQFLDAGPFVLWCCPGMMFKLASWLIAYQFIAKAESRLYIFTELAGGVIYLVLSLIGYRWGGLAGLGIAFSVNYLLYLSIVFIIAVKRYGFSFSGSFVQSSLLQFLLIAGAMTCIMVIDAPLKYWLCSALTACSCCFAVYMLDKKMDIRKLLKERFSTKRD